MTSGSSGSAPADGPLLRCIQCDTPMTIIRGTITWDGDWETNTYLFECRGSGCLTSAEAMWRTFIPIDVAQMRDG